MAIESKAWLRSKTTIEEVESSPDFSHVKQFQSTFKSWEQFKLKITPGDELWSYSGHGGMNIAIALVRNGEIVEDHIILER